MKRKKHKRRNRTRRDNNSIFVGTLMVRDVRFDKVFEVRDKELGSAIEDLNIFIHDKLQKDVEIKILPRPRDFEELPEIGMF